MPHSAPQRLLPFLLPFLLAACQPDTPAATETAAPKIQQLRYDLGRPLVVPARPRRIMALAPYMTEMLFAVADTATIVARTQVCDYPAAALRKPVVSGYPLDMEKVVAIHPDVVFTVEGMTSLEDAARLASFGIPVYYQRCTTAHEVPGSLNELGRILGDSLRPATSPTRCGGSWRP